jgi:ribosomal protein S18 acetylase RimI-like enzyme
LQVIPLVFKSVYNTFVIAPALQGKIRRVDPRRDLGPIADLIELCFIHQMDDDGRDYLRHIRRAARDLNLQRWVKGSNEQVSVPLFGYVWEENSQIIGNLTLIPFYRGDKWRYLIANVATHPDFRGRGIARQLTQTGIRHVREGGASAVWLQVREDNWVAHQLYLQLGFVERARRTTWGLSDSPPPLLPLNGYQVTWRHSADWKDQVRWLQQTYPPEVAWNLNFSADRFAPGFLRSFSRFLNNERQEQWAVRLGSNLVGVATWDASSYNSESVWLAPNPSCEDQALTALLTILRRHVHTNRALMVNYPANRGASSFRRTGFDLQNTLVWMEIPFEPEGATL